MSNWLSSFLQDFFPESVRKSGRGYTEAVRVTSSSRNRVTADVAGSQIYPVELRLDSPRLLVSCCCSTFEQSNACPHLWATALVSETKGYLMDAAFHPPAKLVAQRTPAQSRPLPTALTPVPPPAPPKRYRGQTWKYQLAELEQNLPVAMEPAVEPARRLSYIIDPVVCRNKGRVVIEFFIQQLRKNGEWGTRKAADISYGDIGLLHDPEDREILALLIGCQPITPYTPVSDRNRIPQMVQLNSDIATVLLPRVCQTGRCFLQLQYGDEPTLLNWDGAGPWEFAMAFGQADNRWRLAGLFRRGQQTIALSDPLLVLDGLFFTRGFAAAYTPEGSFSWIFQLRRIGEIEVPDGEQEEFVERLLGSTQLPPVELPEQYRVEEIRVTPRPLLDIRDARKPNQMSASLAFDYQGCRIPSGQAGRTVYRPDAGHIYVRDIGQERTLRTRLMELGLKPPQIYGAEPVYEFARQRLPVIVNALLREGWQVSVGDRAFRRPGSTRMNVTTGIDWFDVNGEVEFEGAKASLPKLLAAIKRGDHVVMLDDGTCGVLPEEWLRQYGTLASLGSVEGDAVRFRRSQAGLLDVLMADRELVDWDEGFEAARQRLRTFEGVQAAEQPAEFRGELRPYQREGLGWMDFLQRFSFGGCLADDMGVGKTAQVLALLETRRTLRETDPSVGPSLVVMPRSLIFNWQQEAARFTPRLRVLDFSVPGRGTDSLAECDIALSTYGTLRRDITAFREVDFDYVVLDEAQAIKNAGTESAKAARLLKARHRLALSGTPIENHLGELWSLFEFLNPGMLGSASVFSMVSGAAGRHTDEETRQVISRALRPFILRRTKQQVAAELPEKTEQTLFCELDKAQRELYNELRDHYRASLLNRLDRHGLAKSKMHVLEALLRLRQAACHPGLIRQDLAEESSAKLDMLLPQLAEVMEEGHKALVFSQFTSMLAIVRSHLDKQGVSYQYLDGQTVDRQARVEEFQNDPDCRLFLISLKAGGLGLNLTAADYVFLLDPWWNPAVEAQAIDRTHRIGQTRRVFAYRLIARDTVEEKVLELQKTKRDLADAIITADNSLIRTMGREELEMLLS